LGEVVETYHHIICIGFLEGDCHPLWRTLSKEGKYREALKVM